MAVVDLKKIIFEGFQIESPCDSPLSRVISFLPIQVSTARIIL
jgi:hypothetical protein